MVPMQFKRRRPCASALWKSAKTFGWFMDHLPCSGFPGGVGDGGSEQPTDLFRCETGYGRMIRTPACGAHHLTTHLADCPNGGHPDLSMGNHCGQLCHRHSKRALDRHASNTTWVRACPPDNIGWEITPPAHDQRLIRNRFRDNKPLLRLLTLEIMQAPMCCR